MNKIDRTNKNWNNTITDEEIFNREFSIGYLVQSNQHLEIFKDLKDVVFSTYKVRAVFKYNGYNGESLTCNGQKLVWRANKFKDFNVGKNVKMISHNLSHEGGGSNNHPSIAFRGAFCEIEFISYGLPHIYSVNGWSIKVIELQKLVDEHTQN